MSLIVQKYGGTSVGTPERLRLVAARVARTAKSGKDLVVVVSAMGETTDQLIALARAVDPSPPQREMDMLLTAGERISMALLAMALRQESIEAISFTGSQSGIITDSSHGSARILEVRCDRIREELARGRVVIVAGFQGVSRQREITTLGRGGSDTTAVALAAALAARECEIYTDVPGVMTADPRVVPEARVIPQLSFETALTLTSLGAGVLVPRAAALGKKLGVSIVVRSSWSEDPGTRIKEGDVVETESAAAVTSTGPVVMLQCNVGGGAPGDLAVLALSQPAAESPALMVVSAADAARLPGPPAELARGDLVSLVAYGAMTTKLIAKASAAASAAGIPVLGAFAGPRSYSVLVDSAQAAELTRRWHEEIIEQPSS